MPQVARDAVKERAARLRKRGEAALRRHLDGEVGQVRRVLTETAGAGRTEPFTPVRLEGALAPGQIVAAKITGHDGRRLIAMPQGGTA